MLMGFQPSFGGHRQIDRQRRQGSQMEDVLYCSGNLLPPPDGQACGGSVSWHLQPLATIVAKDLVVWYARIWVILVLLQFQPHLFNLIIVFAPIAQNTDLVGMLVCRQSQWTWGQRH
jgi:hypothetical protein